VLDHIHEPGTALVDVRSPQVYSGERTHAPDYPQEGALQAGHIPTAVNIPWAQAVAQDGTFKRRDELETLYESQDVTPDERKLLMTQTNGHGDTPPLIDLLDNIDELAGIAHGTPLHQLRGQRPDVARYAQGSYLALLEPEDPAGVSRIERESIALRVALLSSNPALADHHRVRLQQLDAVETIAAIEQFPNGPALPGRLAAILRHTDLLTTDPGGASRPAIDELRAQGLGARDIVTIAQLIAYLSFKVRVLACLRLFAEVL
jgi:CMD domain protein